MLVAVLVDRQAVDVFEHEIRLVVRAYPGIEQPRDVRVRELCEVPAFQGEALRSRAAGGAGEEFHGNLALEAVVTALRAPHGTHAAAADRPGQPVLAELLARLTGEFGLRVSRGRPAHQAGNA